MVQKKAEEEEEKIKKLFKGDISCKHCYIIDDEIGILCRLCGYVITEIRDVSPPFVSESKFQTIFPSPKSALHGS